MTSVSQSPLSPGPRAATPTPQSIFLVVGLACVVGFVVNLLAAAIPPDPMALEWRLGFMQQVSGRSILLFLGIAMVVYGSLGQRALSRYLALVCLIVGILYLLSGVIVIRDGLVIQGQAIDTIDSEVTEIRSRLQTAQTTPNLPAEIAPQRIEEALVQLETQAVALTQNARSSTTRAMISVLSTQVVVGLGFLGLGRFGVKHSA